MCCRYVISDCGVPLYYLARFAVLADNCSRASEGRSQRMNEVLVILLSSCGCGQFFTFVGGEASLLNKLK